MDYIEKLSIERNDVREILYNFIKDFEDEFEDKDFKNIERIFYLIYSDERLINDLMKKNDNLSEAKMIIKCLLWDLRNRDYDCTKDIEKAEEFVKE